MFTIFLQFQPSGLSQKITLGENQKNPCATKIFLMKTIDARTSGRCENWDYEFLPIFCTAKTHKLVQ